MFKSIMTLANMLTIFRIVLVPVYLWYFARQTWESVVIALIVFIVAAVTDLFDGRLARSMKEVTKFGKFMDPLADKFLVIGALVQFWLMGLVNGWFVAVIVIRDIYVTYMRVHAITSGTELRTSGDAKLKTTIQLTVIITTIVFTGGRMIAKAAAPGYTGGWVDLEYYRLFFNGLVFIAAAFTVYSWMRYLTAGKAAKA